MSNKKLRNVRFEVPQMSEEMGGAVLFQTLEDAQQAAEEFGAYAVWKVRGNVFAPAPTGDIWSNESGQWLKVPKDFRCSEHANSKFA
jgi:NAD(P)H-hydrate repair Nnr-like enzyme with NAD(P)H-hydrate dehydratase domain